MLQAWEARVISSNAVSGIRAHRWLRVNLSFVRVAEDAPEGARELLETPSVCYFARLNAMTAQLEPAAEIHWS
jgi:hypothetical protein